MHRKTEPEGRIENVLFTRHGVVSLDHVAVRNFNTSGVDARSTPS